MPHSWCSLLTSLRWILASLRSTTSKSRIFWYLNGHGVDSTLKLQQSSHYITSGDINKVMQELWDKSRYNEFLLFVDTCEGESFFDDISAPNAYLVTSSDRE